MEEGPHPKPGAGSGNREKIPVDGEEIHRLHIRRTYTVLYDILEDGMGFCVVGLLSIDEVYDRYGF